MLPTRYKPARTLVRPLGRLPHEPRKEFVEKCRRVRMHFEQFNIDVADLCQWLMSLRPNTRIGDAQSTVFWDFFLNPSILTVEADEKERDRWRLAAFDELLQIRFGHDPNAPPWSEEFRSAIRHVAQRPKSATAQRLFDRLRSLTAPHRLVLLKSAAEWIIARYQRGMENWQRQFAEWQREKEEWEAAHPNLTPEVRDAFTRVFKNLFENPDGDGKIGVRRKNPRICSWERLKLNKDNCVYAGQKGHGPLCWEFSKFVKAQKNAGTIKTFFVDVANKYLHVRRNLSKPGVKLKKSPRQEAFKRLYNQKGMEKARNWFTDAWSGYLTALNLNEKTILDHGCLKHCGAIGAEFEKSLCQFNPHTHLCVQYRNALESLEPAIRELEGDYREWRRLFLAPPRKPSFRYPSSRRLPMPKIFGEHFHQIDFDQSILRLRLEDMAEGEWIEFGFKPWPKDYRPGKDEVRVTSVHVNFHGNRMRAGFHFEAPAKPSRFACTQDELDDLRSKQFPRQSQDRQLLEVARRRLLESFDGMLESDLRILAVDLGEKGAAAAVYQGHGHEADVAIPIVKIDRLYDHVPDVLDVESARVPPPKFDDSRDPRGVRKEHVGRHLGQLQRGAQTLAQHRQQDESAPAALRRHDFRALTRHIRWMIRDWTRHNAAQITAAAETHRCHLIVFESLRGFKPRGYDQMDFAQKARLAFFAYGRVRRKVVEKAVERGLRVVTVPYGFTSQICSECGHRQRNKGRLRKNKYQRRFVCECGEPKKSANKTAAPDRSATVSPCTCRLQLGSDVNAARVLARVFWDEIVLPTREEMREPAVDSAPPSK